MGGGVSFEKDFAPIKEDKEFMNKLFPEHD